MSTSDDQRDRTRGDDEESERADREIAIPGYRRPGSQGPRHRPPSVQRSEAAGRRSTGAHRAVRVTGSQSAVRTTGSHRAVRTTGSQSAVPATGPQRTARATGAQSAVRTTGGHRAVRSTGAQRAVRANDTSKPPQAGAGITGRASVSRARSEPSPPAGVESKRPATGPRGIDELQAEMARDDIRLMARQIAQGRPVEGRSTASVVPPSADRFAAMIKWRPYVAAALVVLALVIGMLPVLSTSSARSAHARLANAVQQAARSAGAASGAGDVSGWINDRDLEALRAFYAEQRPRIIQALHGAGFEEITPGDVTIRVDYDAATLVIGAQVDDGEGGKVVVSADLSGELTGRRPPPGGLGPAFDEQGGLLLSLLTGALALSGLLWLIPAVAERRRA